MDRNEIIEELYNKYSFVEEDRTKFREIVLSKIVKDDDLEKKAKENITKYLVNQLKKGNFLSLFKKSVDKRGLEFTYKLFDIVLQGANIDISEEIIETLGEIKEYSEFYKGLCEKNDLSMCELLSEVVDYYKSMNESEDSEIEGIDFDKILSNNKDKYSMVVTKDPLNDYLRYISQFEVFTREEEIAAFKKWKTTKDIADRDYFIEHNLRLVAKIAFQIHHPEDKLEILDLIQEGNAGLVIAVKKFSLNRGCKFSTYATWWIKQRMERALLDQGNTIRIPVHMGERLKKYRKFIRAFEKEFYREPTDEEICENLDITMANLQDLKDADIIKSPASIDKAIENDDSRKGDETAFGDFLKDENAMSVEDKSLNEVLKDELLNCINECLDEREKEIIEKRFALNGGKKYTLEEIGKMNGVTRERIRQIEAKALKKLRNGVRRKHISKEDIID